ncbi:unnamed protein product [Chrysodeixis includens]|uniref:Peptidase S1 domain-containing protein n=1 Tax=Chrysodeixis includens TaxID=689277 RepID=A0A9N8L769_CHRIL|nr:unnamed protein product [Chrysodeixis includens]
MTWAGGSYLNILAILMLLNAFKYVKPHVQSSISSELSEEGLLIEAPLKNSMRAQYDSIPIDFHSRRDLSMAANEIIGQPINSKTLFCKFISFKYPAMPATMATTRRPTPSPEYPPLDRRFRRIYNPDEVASVEDYPYMAALLVNNELWCGAVIIDMDKILTAAHCLQLQYNNRFFREYVKMLTVRVGSTNATSGGELLRVSEIFFHPNYKPQTLEFNFAVLKTHKNMTFGRKDPYIEKITFSRDKVIPVDNQIMFLGWGSVLGISGAGGQVLLQKVKLPVYDSADCQEIYGKDLVTRSNFCAGYITIPKNVCNHDAGGPAIMDGALIGVLSFSARRCDAADQPAVFSTVGAVANWLDNLGEKKVQLR